MTFVTITEAAKLVGRSRKTLYRDIDSGRLSKTVTDAGGTTIDTSELLRVYGNLHREADSPSEKSNGIPGQSSVDEFVELVDRWEAKPLAKGTGIPETSAHIHILEEKIKSLEHVLKIEAALRKVKDEVTDELRARLEDKDRVIRMLETKVLLLDYNGPEDSGLARGPRRFLSRLFGMN